MLLKVYYKTESCLSPAQRLPLGNPIKISIIEKIESALSFSFSPASPQHKEASAEETRVLRDQKVHLQYILR